MFKPSALAFCLVAAFATPAFAESPSTGRAVAVVQPVSRVLRLDWWHLRAILPDTYSVQPALQPPRIGLLLGSTLLDKVVVVSGTPVLLVDEPEPHAARWGLGCSLSACTALARGSF